jgi:hypothetical protein
VIEIGCDDAVRTGIGREHGPGFELRRCGQRGYTNASYLHSKGVSANPVHDNTSWIKTMMSLSTSDGLAESQAIISDMKANCHN